MFDRLENSRSLPTPDGLSPRRRLELQQRLITRTMRIIAAPDRIPHLACVARAHAVHAENQFADLLCCVLIHSRIHFLRRYQMVASREKKWLLSSFEAGAACVPANRAAASFTTSRLVGTYPVFTKRDLLSHKPAPFFSEPLTALYFSYFRNRHASGGPGIGLSARYHVASEAEYARNPVSSFIRTGS